MKIIMCTTGYAINNGKPTQKAGSAVIMRAEDEAGRKISRTIAHPVGNCTTPRAQISAAIIALASVKKRFRREGDIHLTVDPYVYRLLQVEDGEFKLIPKSNVEQAEELRRWYSYFTNVEIECGGVNDLSAALIIARECADKQDKRDSGTQMFI